MRMDHSERRKVSALLSSLLFSAFASYLIAPVALFADQVKLSETITAEIPAPWRIVPTTIRNMTQVELPAGDARGQQISLRVIISLETRPDHKNALSRL